MQISDIRAYSDNARLFAGEKQVVEPRPGKVTRSTLNTQPEQTVAGMDTGFSSDELYKGNFIDTFA